MGSAGEDLEKRKCEKAELPYTLHWFLFSCLIIKLSRFEKKIIIFIEVKLVFLKSSGNRQVTRLQQTNLRRRYLNETKVLNGNLFELSDDEGIYLLF